MLDGLKGKKVYTKLQFKKFNILTLLHLGSGFSWFGDE